MQGDSTNDAIRKIRKQLIQAQVLYERGKKLPQLLADSLRLLKAPEEQIAYAEKRDRQYQEMQFKLLRSTLLLQLAMLTHAEEDYEKAFNEILDP